MARALITCKVDPIFTQNLEAAGIDYEYNPGISYNACIEQIGDYEILVISTSIRVDMGLILQAEKLQIVARLGSGLEHIDQKALSDKGIALLSSPMGNARAVAEHVLGLILNYSKHIGKAIDEVKHGVWKREANRGMEIEAKKIGIIGFGSNGCMTAQLLKAAGMELYIYDKYKAIDTQEWESCESPEELISKVEFLSFHVPYNEETYHYFNDELLQHALSPIVLINISRGEIVDTETVMRGLESGQIIGALLDVIEDEKLQVDKEILRASEVNRKLINHPQVFLTPHIAGYSWESLYKMSLILSQKIVKTLA